VISAAGIISDDVDMRYARSSQTITCTSTGGPATTVSWRKDGVPIVLDGSTYQQSQIITDTRAATYQNKLTIVSKSSSLSGTYTCSIGNTWGTVMASTSITGQMFVPMLQYSC